jgi:hypothetical protein
VTTVPKDPWVKPASNVESLHAQITDALAELRGAREIAPTPPVPTPDKGVDLAEWRLDVLLLRQKATTEAQAAADKLVSSAVVTQQTIT